jgi:hypothetical protein
MDFKLLSQQLGAGYPELLQYPYDHGFVMFVCPSQPEKFPQTGLLHPGNEHDAVSLLQAKELGVRCIGPEYLLAVLGNRFGVHAGYETHGSLAGPTVRIYDRNYVGGKFGPKGQFVASYYASTLWKDGVTVTHGLCFHGGVPSWAIQVEENRKLQQICGDILRAVDSYDKNAKAI